MSFLKGSGARARAANHDGVGPNANCVEAEPLEVDVAVSREVSVFHEEDVRTVELAHEVVEDRDVASLVTTLLGHGREDQEIILAIAVAVAHLEVLPKVEEHVSVTVARLSEGERRLRPLLDA